MHEKGWIIIKLKKVAEQKSHDNNGRWKTQDAFFVGLFVCYEFVSIIFIMIQRAFRNFLLWFRQDESRNITLIIRKIKNFISTSNIKWGKWRSFWCIWYDYRHILKLEFQMKTFLSLLTLCWCNQNRCQQWLLYGIQLRLIM